MKKNTVSYSLCFFVLCFISNISFAQVGINTTDPKGILDFNDMNVTTMTLGVVYPNVALVASDDPSPVVNPQGGPIVEGTVVYNTNTTNTGAVTDVYPGVYVWDGTQWVIHYKKRQSELFNQTALIRTEANFVSDWQDVPGLGIAAANTFTAKYSGLYRIEVKTNFGAGRTNTNSNTFVGMASGQFRLLFDGTPYTFDTSAFSAYTTYIGGGTYYEDIWKESYETRYVNLIAGTTYPFSLCFDAYDAPGFLGNGSTSTAPTSVDLINENFDSHTINQINSSSGCGSGSSTNGWIISAGAGTCTACAGNRLYVNSNKNTCIQNATALISFTPTVSSVNINFDYQMLQKNGTADSFRVYIYDEDNLMQVGANLISLIDTNDNTSYSSGVITLTPGTAYTLRFEYIATKSNYASVDNVVISELSGPSTTVTEGRGYIGNEIDCQIEFTYIGE